MATVIERQTKARPGEAKGERRLYVVFHAIDRETGKRRKVWELARGGKKEANARKAEIESGLYRNGGLWPLEPPADPEPQELMFDEYAASWLENRARHRVTPRVLENYDRAIRLYLSPALGSLRLNEIRRRHVNDLMAQLADRGLARNSARNVLIPLRRMLNDAVDDELIVANPATRIELPDTAPLRKAVIPSSDELDRIIAAARSDDVREVLTVVAALGLRRGEAFALRWRDIAFHEGVVYVRATNHRGRIADRTKSRAGTRLVPLFESARKVLATRRLRLPAE